MESNIRNADREAERERAVGEYKKEYGMGI